MRVANLLAAVLLSGAVAVTTPAAAENPAAQGDVVHLTLNVEGMH